MEYIEPSARSDSRERFTDMLSPKVVATRCKSDLTKWPASVEIVFQLGKAHSHFPLDDGAAKGVTVSFSKFFRGIEQHVLSKGEFGFSAGLSHGEA